MKKNRFEQKPLLYSIKKIWMCSPFETLTHTHKQIYSLVVNLSYIDFFFFISKVLNQIVNWVFKKKNYVFLVCRYMYILGIFFFIRIHSCNSMYRFLWNVLNLGWEKRWEDHNNLNNISSTRDCHKKDCVSASYLCNGKVICLGRKRIVELLNSVPVIRYL